MYNVCTYMMVRDISCTHLYIRSFIGQGEFGEVYQGTAYDILGSDTGLHPVAIKVQWIIIN